MRKGRQSNWKMGKWLEQALHKKRISKWLRIQRHSISLVIWERQINTTIVDRSWHPAGAFLPQTNIHAVPSILVTLPLDFHKPLPSLHSGLCSDVILSQRLSWKPIIYLIYLHAGLFPVSLWTLSSDRTEIFVISGSRSRTPGTPADSRAFRGQKLSGGPWPSPSLAPCFLPVGCSVPPMGPGQCAEAASLKLGSRSRVSS